MQNEKREENCCLNRAVSKTEPQIPTLIGGIVMSLEFAGALNFKTAFAAAVCELAPDLRPRQLTLLVPKFLHSLAKPRQLFLKDAKRECFGREPG